MKRVNVTIALHAALKELLKRDGYLLRVDANERSISHRLAIYLEPYFDSWDVDCEYNRNHDDTKRLLLEQRETNDEDLHAVTVFPDIIVHRRATDENLLVIEMKKSTSWEGDSYDLKKLNAFKRELKYQYAAFVKLTAGSANPDIGLLRFM